MKSEIASREFGLFPGKPLARSLKNKTPSELGSFRVSFLAVSKSTDLFTNFTGIAVLKCADAFFKAEINSEAQAAAVAEQPAGPHALCGARSGPARADHRALAHGPAPHQFYAGVGEPPR